MKTLVIEKQAIKQNVAVIKERAGSAVIYAALTGDAYGAGLVEMAKLLRDEGIGRFAVGSAKAAEDLRKAGLVEEEILMLRSTTDREELERLVDLNAVCTIGSVDAGLALNGLAESRSTVVEAHVQVDTGMGYGGFLAGEPDKVLSVYRNLPNVALSGIYTQIHSAKPDGRDATVQMGEFNALLEAIRAAGFETGTVHAAGSFALLHYDFARMDAVRPGSAFLGRCRRTKGDGLQRVGYGEAGLEDVRWLPQGHTVGNEVLITLKRPTRVGIIPVGYQNGFCVARTRDSGLTAAIRRWWRRRKITVRIAGQKVKVIGRIGAMETLVDVTDMKCSAGDTVLFDIDPLYAKGLAREYR